MNKIFNAVVITVIITIVLVVQLPTKNRFIQQQQQIPYEEHRNDARFLMNTTKGNLIQSITQEYYLIPNQVMFYWCAKPRNRFEFQHYLSMCSAIRSLQPDIIFFIYDEYPEIDKFEYNTWLEELKQTYPLIRMEERKEKNGCNGTMEDKLAVITEELSRRGGIYVHETTILSPSIVSLLKGKQQVIGINRTTGHGFLMTQKGITIPQIYEQDVNCTDSSLLSNHSSAYCIITPKSIYPKDIWELDNEFGKLSRWAAYGETSILLPTHDYSELAPNIAHYVWIGNGTMDYIWYLSVLSLLHIIKVDRVFIHGEAPTGMYWKQIMNNDKVKVIPRNPETFVFGQRVKRVAHKADVWRFDIMNKYGGLYLDTDAVFVKPLSDHLRAFDAVANIDFIGSYWIDEYPNVIQVGVLLGKPGRKFWSESLQTMRIYRDNLWVWNSCHLPYKVKERNPRLLLIEERFQVNCFCGKCHPTWWPNYKSRAVHHLNSNSLPNWRNDSYCYHFTGIIPAELREEDLAMHSESIFGEMARHVLDKAGLFRIK